MTLAGGDCPRHAEVVVSTDTWQQDSQEKNQEEMTAYPAVRAEVEAAGCSWVDGVVRDGNLVTGQAWPDHPEWLAEFTNPLGDNVSHGDPISADGDRPTPLPCERYLCRQEEALVCRTATNPTTSRTSRNRRSL